jgi:hypothetical protein
VTAEKAKNPARLAKFVINVETPGVDAPEHVEGVRRAVGKCLVKNTLSMPPEIVIEMGAPKPAQA